MPRAILIGVVSFVGLASCTAVEDEHMQVRNGALPDCESDVLYIGDLGKMNKSNDDSIVQFDVNEGKFAGYLVTPGNNFLNGPMGILVDQNGHVLLANQNIGEPNSGEILVIEPSDKGPPEIEVLVEPTTDEDPPPLAPWAPRGMVLGDDNVLYVVDLGDTSHEGRITLWDSETGAYLGDLDFTGFDGWIAPRGIVFGPDGYIYVSNTNLTNTDLPPELRNLGGSILRFDPETGEFVDVVYECPADPECLLNRPEGLVFGPDGRLYVTSFRANVNDIDRILIFEIDEDGQGTLVDTIDLYQSGETRSFSQAILFGPDDALYVPITNPSSPPPCAIRKYEVVGVNEEWEWECFVGPGHTLERPFYLTFGGTNPSTLAYECD